jgi:hypothetical protein
MVLRDLKLMEIRRHGHTTTPLHARVRRPAAALLTRVSWCGSAAPQCKHCAHSTSGRRMRTNINACYATPPAALIRAHRCSSNYLRHCPVNILRGILDVTRLAVQAVLRIDHKPHLPVGSFHIFIHLSRAIPNKSIKRETRREPQTCFA